MLISLNNISQKNESDVAGSSSYGPHFLPQAIQGRIPDPILRGQLYIDQQTYDKDATIRHITTATNLIFRSVSRSTYKRLRKIEHFGRETTLLPGPIFEAWMAMREKAIRVNKFDKFYATCEVLSCSNYQIGEQYFCLICRSFHNPVPICQETHITAHRSSTMWRVREGLLLFHRMSKAGLEIPP